MYCYPTAFPRSPHHNCTFIISCDQLFYFLSISVRVLCYQPSCHNCYHLANIFKFVTAKILFQRWKQTKIAGRRIPLTQIWYCTFFMQLVYVKLYLFPTNFTFCWSTYTLLTLRHVLTNNTSHLQGELWHKEHFNANRIFVNLTGKGYTVKVTICSINIWY